MASLLAPASPFDPPSLLYVLLTQPAKLALRLVDHFFARLRTGPKPGLPVIRVVCISDTHCLLPDDLPSGDVLIHAGDLTNAGTPAELQAQVDWLDSLPFEHKIAIAGNHDTWLDPRSRATLPPDVRGDVVRWKSVRYLQHSSMTLKFRGSNRLLNVYGAPQIPACGGDEFAFQYPRGSDAWTGTLPRDVDILVTHTPPKHHLDLPASLGCEFLLSEVEKVRPSLHIFGHVHAGRSDLLGWLKGGREIVHWDAGQRRLEKALNRPGGLVRSILDPRSLLDLLRLFVHCSVALFWDRVWGGSTGEPTIMINAAMVYNNTGRLGPRPQVIDL